MRASICRQSAGGSCAPCPRSTARATFWVPLRPRAGWCVVVTCTVIRSRLARSPPPAQWQQGPVSQHHRVMVTLIALELVGFAVTDSVCDACALAQCHMPLVAQTSPLRLDRRSIAPAEINRRRRTRRGWRMSRGIAVSPAPPLPSCRPWPCRCKIS